MRFVVLVFLSVAAASVAPTTSASCLPKTFTTFNGENGYFYVIDAANAASTGASIVGKFWSPGAYATTGEQGCDDSHWLLGGGPSQHSWYINGTLGQMGCTSGCPATEMIVSLEDTSSDGSSAFFAVGRIDETPVDPVFDFSRLGRNWTFAPIPAPVVLATTTGELFTAQFLIPDPDPGFYGLPGVPASSTITAFRLYTKPNATGPRERASWSYVGRYPYAGGTTSGQATLVCPATGGYPFLAAAIELDSGQVVTTYLSHATMVECDTYAAGAGGVADGGPSGLFVDKDPDGDLALRWGRSCSIGDNNYEVYEGAIGDWTSHVPRGCAAGFAATLTPPPFDGYYLIVPSEDNYEGSYGTRSGGVERPLGASVCRTRLINACPP